RLLSPSGTSRSDHAGDPRRHGSSPADVARRAGGGAAGRDPNPRRQRAAPAIAAVAARAGKLLYSTRDASGRLAAGRTPRAGCGGNATLDGGKTWTPTLPSGFIPGITAFTNDPAVPGTGTYDFGGDPAVAFSPDGSTAYFTCFGYKGKNVALWLSHSTDGGRTWTPGGLDHPLTLVSAFQGEGKARGSNGQFPDHESITVADDGTIYVAWAHFTGFSAHSPIFIAVSRDGGNSFALPVKVSSGSVRSDQDARIAVDPRTGYAYVTFDNSIQGGKGTAMYVSVSKDHGATWSNSIQFATFQNPVCLYPPYCFNISGAQYRAPGSYPAPAFDPTTNRLYVAYTDIVAVKAQIFLTSANVTGITTWKTPQVVA